jgi:DNA-binding CsgD family transcriptional regulator
MRLVKSAGEPVLSKREQDVVRGVTEGLSNREIARCPGLTEPTAKNYLFRIFDKLGVSSRVEVVLYVFRFRKHKDWMAASPSGPAPVRASGPKLLTTPSKPTGRMGHKMAPIIAAGM